MESQKIAIKNGDGFKKVSLLKKSPKIERITAISEEKTYVDKETGEEITAQTIIKRIDRKGFEITYLAYVFELFELLGNRKMQVFKTILENKNIDNQLMITVRELAERSKVSLRTVHQTLTTLEEKGLIKRRTGGIMVIPKLAHKGNGQREKNLMLKFQEFNNSLFTEDDLK